MNDPPRSDLAKFCSDLERRRVDAGRPSYAQIVKLADVRGDQISKATISNLLTGRNFPRWESVRTYLYAVMRYEDPGRSDLELAAELKRWQKRWVEVFDSQPAASGRSSIGAEPGRADLPDISTERLMGRDEPAEWGSVRSGSLLGGEVLLRDAIFDRLAKLVSETGAASREQLWNFTLGDQTLRLIDRNRGIRSPRGMQAALSIISDPASPYTDNEHLGDSLLAYRYREGSAEGDNNSLRQAFNLQLPIILLRKIDPACYVPIFPVYVVADDRVNRRFLLSLENRLPNAPGEDTSSNRSLGESLTMPRIRRAEFRARVLRADRYRCTICGLGNAALLDAVNILRRPGAYQEMGLDGALSMCVIHHRAYDQNLLGITPELVVQVRRKIMDEECDHMQHYVLQAMHGRRLIISSRKMGDRPSAELLAERYHEFMADE